MGSRGTIYSEQREQLYDSRADAQCRGPFVDGGVTLSTYEGRSPRGSRELPLVAAVGGVPARAWRGNMGWIGSHSSHPCLCLCLRYHLRPAAPKITCFDREQLPQDSHAARAPSSQNRKAFADEQAHRRLGTLRHHEPFPLSPRLQVAAKGRRPGWLCHGTAMDLHGIDAMAFLQCRSKSQGNWQWQLSGIMGNGPATNGP